MSLRHSLLKMRNSLAFMMLSPILVGPGSNVIVDTTTGINPSCEVQASALNDSTYLRIWTAIVSEVGYEMVDGDCDGRIDAMERYIDGIDRIIPDVHVDVDGPKMPFGAPWPFTIA